MLSALKYTICLFFLLFVQQLQAQSYDTLLVQGLDNLEHGLVMQGQEYVVKDSDTLLVIRETLPEFPGGDGAMFRYLGKKLKLPKQNHAEGRLVVAFTISETGKVENAYIIESVHPEIDSMAVSLVRKFPKWKPATQNGKKVKSYYRIPIRITNEYY